MSNWKGIIGIAFTPEEFKTYVEDRHWTGWRPTFIVLHNTGSPNLAQRPDGLTHQHILNLEGYYRDTQKWSAGPHLFVDDRQIWVFTPLTTQGVHSPSWNAISLGVEMLGDYSTDSFTDGRGQKVHQNAVAAIAILSAQLSIDPASMKLHKEDTKTKHDCPGRNVNKPTFISEVKKYIAAMSEGDHHEIK